MANEHVLHVRTGHPINFTVANGTGIEKGTLLILSDPFTAGAVAAVRGKVAGVLAKEKIASDGITKAAVYREGIFKATASGTVTVGDALSTDHAGNKLVSTASVQGLSGSIIVGIALETASDGETFFYELRPQYVNMGITL